MMRIAALLGATVLALSAAPALAGSLFDDLNPFTPDRDDAYVYRPHRHHHGYRSQRGPRGYAMVAPGVLHTPVGLFFYDDTLGEWEHWKD